MWCWWRDRRSKKRRIGGGGRGTASDVVGNGIRMLRSRYLKCTVFRTGVHKEIWVCAKTWEHRFVLGNSCGSPLKRVCAEVEGN